MRHVPNKERAGGNAGPFLLQRCPAGGNGRVSRESDAAAVLDRHPGAGRDPVATPLDDGAALPKRPGMYATHDSKWSLLDPGLRRDDGFGNARDMCQTRKGLAETPALFCLNAATLGFAALTPTYARRLRTALAVIAVITLGLGVGFAHVRALLGLAVPLVARAVIDLAARVDPHHARTAARRRGGVR